MLHLLDSLLVRSGIIFAFSPIKVSERRNDQIIATSLITQVR